MLISWGYGPIWSHDVPWIKFCSFTWFTLDGIRLSLRTRTIPKGGPRRFCSWAALTPARALADWQSQVFTRWWSRPAARLCRLRMFTATLQWYLAVSETWYDNVWSSIIDMISIYIYIYMISRLHPGYTLLKFKTMTQVACPTPWMMPPASWAPLLLRRRRFRVLPPEANLRDVPRSDIWTATVI